MARSAELGGACALLGALLALMVCGPGIWRACLEMVRGGLGASPANLAVGGVEALYAQWLVRGLRVMAPVLLTAALTAVLANLAQTGFLYSTYPLRWDLARLSPTENFRKLFSVQGAVMAGKSTLKIAVVLAVALVVLAGRVDEILAAGSMELPAAAQLAWRLVVELSLKGTIVLLVLGVLDYAYQRYTYEQTLKMTRQEVRQELRDTEGDPQIQARRRQMRMALLQGRISREMPQASVVITNPTHYAIALRYSPEHPAPKVVAKGQGPLAQRIMEYARRYGIPIHQDRPLAQNLYRQVRVGDMIPPALFRAVAEVLAIILRRREQQRQRLPR